MDQGAFKPCGRKQELSAGLTEVAIIIAKLHANGDELNGWFAPRVGLASRFVGHDSASTLMIGKGPEGRRPDDIGDTECRGTIPGMIDERP
jgi:hypothetical protein